MSSLISSTPFGMPSPEEARNRMKMGQEMAQIGNLQRAAKVDSTKAMAAAKEYESAFLSQMLEHLFAGIETDEITGGGESEEIYRSMMIDQYGQTISKAGGIGIARNVYDALMKHQEIDAKGAAS